MIDNLPSVTAPPERLVWGSFLKFVNGEWSTRDGSDLPKTPIFVRGTTRVVQRWHDQVPIETIREQLGQPLADVDELNAKIPQSEWEIGVDGKPRPPYQKQSVAWFFDPASGKRYTFASGTIGARRAIDDLEESWAWMRRLKGDVIPVVELSSATMRTKYGQRKRPNFEIRRYCALAPDDKSRLIVKDVDEPNLAEDVDDSTDY